MNAMFEKRKDEDFVRDNITPKSQADRIRAMSDEELAEYLSELIRNAHEYHTGEGDWLQWLKSEVKE